MPAFQSARQERLHRERARKLTSMTESSAPTLLGSCSAAAANGLAPPASPGCHSGSVCQLKGLNCAQAGRMSGRCH